MCRKPNFDYSPEKFLSFFLKFKLNMTEAELGLSIHHIDD